MMHDMDCVHAVALNFDLDLLIRPRYGPDESNLARFLQSNVLLFISSCPNTRTQPTDCITRRLNEIRRVVGLRGNTLRWPRSWR